MNDVDTRLAELFDEIAASIEPKPDFDSVMGAVPTLGTVATTARGRPGRRALAAAAAVVVVLGGAAAAFQLDDEPSMVATDDVSTPSTTAPAASPAIVVTDDDRTDVTDRSPLADPSATGEAAAVVARTATLGAGRLDTDPIRQIVLGRAAPAERIVVTTPYGGTETTTGPDGRWKTVLELDEVPRATLVPIEVRFGDDSIVELAIVTPAASIPATDAEPEPTIPKQEVPAPPPATAPKPEPTPKPEPKEQPPTPVAFAATLGGGDAGASPMKQVVYGTATPGTKVLVTSAYGHVTVESGGNGSWEAHLKMYEVPAGTNVRITVTASGFPQEYEFWVARPAPAVQEFTAGIAATYLDGDPIKVVLHGTGTPGSTVSATSDFGSAETAITEAGTWELKLKMAGVPNGATVGMRVVDGRTGTVKEFTITKPAAPVPEYHFKAAAAFTDCDDDPPYNEYWGLAAPGSTVTISSPYGGKQVVADGSGDWSARVEFPSAPIGETFQVVLTNSADAHSFSFGFKRLPPP